LKTANVQLNKMVSRGQTLYTVKTKEAESIGNTINILDSSFRFTGVNSIKANGSGFISQIDKQTGDYVQDGDQLAVITDTRSFVFLLNMPYELRPYIINKKSLELVLPDGEKLIGTISGTQPTMDPGSQTQSIILKVNSSHAIPENLIATVTISKSSKSNTYSLPKSAVLADETQTAFWVMKMMNDSIAAKTPVKKGIETNERIEILAPVFSAADRILVTGNFGLNDTAKVKIVSKLPAIKK
jgi:multidrug efflux pump subunit AcrA (membrane-fusion protein)